jgi:Ni/Co efflux regulator RcnB
MKINRPLASLLFAVALAAGPVAALSQQTSTDSGAKPGAKQDMKNAGHETSNAAKDAGNGAKQGTKKAYNKSKAGTKKAYNKSKSTTQGAVDGAKAGAKQPQP